MYVLVSLHIQNGNDINNARATNGLQVDRGGKFNISKLLMLCFVVSSMLVEELNALKCTEEENEEAMVGLRNVKESSYKKLSSLSRKSSHAE